MQDCFPRYTYDVGRKQNGSKKSKVDLNLKKLSTIIILELLCCDLIGIYYINIKNITNLSYMISYEILVIIIFTLVEMYQLSLIRSKVKYIKYKNKKIYV